MREFEEYVRKEREELTRRRDEINRQKQELDGRLKEIEREFAAVEAYERAKKGGGAGVSPTGGKRRTGVRRNVLEVIKRHRDGLKRAEILEQMKVKGDKRAEQSVSNALSNLKKQGEVRLEDGVYKAAA